MKSSNYEQRAAVEKASIDAIKGYIYSLQETIGIADADRWERVHEDVDFTWFRFYPSGNAREVKVKVTVDIQEYQAENLAFETIGNVSKNTPGSFVRTKSNLFIYYFARTQEMWIMDALQTQKWFAEHEGFFRDFKASIKFGPSREDVYTAKGKLVPKKALSSVSEKINLRIVSLMP